MEFRLIVVLCNSASFCYDFKVLYAVSEYPVCFYVPICPRFSLRTITEIESTVASTDAQRSLNSGGTF